MRILRCVLLLACTPLGVSAWPDWKEDQDLANGFMGKLGDIILEKLDDVESSTVIASESSEALHIAKENLEEAKKGKSFQAKQQAKKRVDDASKLAAEASQIAEKKVAMLNFEAIKEYRGCLKEAKSGGDCEDLRLFRKDSSKKVRALFVFSIFERVEVFISVYYIPLCRQWRFLKSQALMPRKSLESWKK